MKEFLGIFLTVLGIVLLITGFVFIIVSIDPITTYTYSGKFLLNTDQEVNDFKTALVEKTNNLSTNQVSMLNSHGATLVILNHVSATEDFSYGTQHSDTYDKEWVHTLTLFSIILGLYLLLIGIALNN